ncbi:thiolase family protein [bacterium]|nr:thiolase family protein [bacterium]
MQREGVCLLGYGELPYTVPEAEGLTSSFSYLPFVARAISLALENAKVEKKDIQGLAMVRLGLPTDTPALAEELGMELDWVQGVDCGGSSAVICIRRAADAIQLGQIDVAVCAAAVIRYKGYPFMGLPSYPTDNHMLPYGYGGPNSCFALTQRRHMEEYGTTLEQLGKVAVSFRKNAEFNENALFRKPLTMDDYLNARMISDPIRLFDCVRVCTGANAVVMASEKVAKGLTDHPVYLVSDNEKTNYQVSHPAADRTVTGFSKLGGELFVRVSREEIDCAQIYDDYPIAVLMQLEDLGFCKKGEGGNFVDEHDITVNGDFPINTGGGELSVGQPSGVGSMLHVVEGLRQLKGEAGGHQVKNAKTALVTGLGLLGYDIPILVASGMILQRR